MIHKDTKEQQTPFSLGSICITPGAQEALSHEDVMTALSRHCRGDWGEVCAEDAQLNDQALVDGSRLLSAYRTLRNVRLWLLTEAAHDQGHRLATTLLLPEEY